MHSRAGLRRGADADSRCQPEIVKAFLQATELFPVALATGGGEGPPGGAVRPDPGGLLSGDGGI
jgi:hypothetical protein